MDYSNFRQLLEKGESYNIDFKLKCGAFDAPSDAPNAELAKDICAMANNGNATSYLIVGVSDDQRRFETVTNPQLTEENVQSFCKQAIFPPPRVKVHREYWTGVMPEHAGKVFVIIQIGPHARQAFRLTRDFISYKEGFCFRRNEVWIRRGRTSDLATPEEITRLTKGQPLEEAPQLEHNIEYDKLTMSERPKALISDIEQVLTEIGGHLVARPNGFSSEPGRKAVVSLEGAWYVWQLVIVEDPRLWTPQLLMVQLSDEFSHGTILLATDTVPQRVFDLPRMMHFKRKWGWFTLVPAPYGRYYSWAELLSQVVWPIFTLPRLRDSATLRQSFVEFLEFLGADSGIFEHVRLARHEMNSHLENILATGQLEACHNGKEREKSARALLALPEGKRPVRAGKGTRTA